MMARSKFESLEERQPAQGDSHPHNRSGGTGREIRHPYSKTFVPERQMTLSYGDWSAQWGQERQYTGAQISEAALPSRIRSIMNLWNGGMPLNWERENWTYLQKEKFRRHDIHSPQPEHKFEKKLFARRSAWEVKG